MNQPATFDLNGIDLLIGQLKAFDGALLVISHDRYFLDMVVDKIWELKDGKITEYWGGYWITCVKKKKSDNTKP
jgi:ATPase subunit of ABC transporter with duplicated ATPase domains